MVSDDLDVQEEIRGVHGALENLWMELGGIAATEEGRRLSAEDDPNDELVDQ